MSTSEQTWKVSGIEIADRAKGGVKESLLKRLLRKIFPDQRTETRCPAPPLMGYLGTMQGSRPFEVGDVSLGGFSLVTEERWAAGTEMPITLRRSNLPVNEPEDLFTVQATVVRWTEEGVAFSIVLFEEDSAAVSGNPLQVYWASRQDMKLFLERLKSPEEMKAGVADHRRENVEDSSRQTAFHTRLHVSPHTAGD
ncbi:MAG: hypothetical protein JST28_07025 [Acidobacteria bacterium]|nr:hypothetical protein [Acidobacteriota bacterium]